MPDAADNVVMWPESPYALADAQLCPACFATLTSMTCGVCGLVLDDPRAPQLLALGRRMLELESERQRVIDTIRIAHLPPPEPEPEPEPEPTLMPEPAPAPAPAPEPTQETPTVGPAASPTWPAPASVPPSPHRRRRLSVPVLLLIVGVSLVGVAAVFFLVYAWFTWGILVRALIIGAITIATIATASLLRRRRLTATAEAIAVLGVLLLALDAWAVRANDFFGTAQVEPALYYGTGILVVGALCRVWAKLSSLRSPDIASVIALPTGLGLLVSGVVSLPVGETVAAGLLGAAAGGLAHALPAPWSSVRDRTDAVLERAILAIIGVTALVLATAVAAFVGTDDVATPIWTGAAIIVLGAAHAYLLRRRPHASDLADEPLPGAFVLAATAAGTAAVVAASLGWQVAVRADLPVNILLVAPVIGVAVPALLDRAHARISGLGAARIAAAVVGGLSLIGAIGWWAYLATGAMATGWVAWQTDAWSAASGHADGAVFAAIAGAVIAALLFIAPTLGRPVLRNVRLVVAGLALLAGVAVLTVPALLVGTAAVIAILAVAALAYRPLRMGAAIVASTAAVIAFTAGMTTPWLWLIGIVVAVGVPIAAQVVVRPTGFVAGWITEAPIVIAAVAAFVAPQAIGAVTATAPEPMVGFVLIQWIALGSLLGAVLLRIDGASRATAVISGCALFLLSLAPYGAAAVASTGAEAAGSGSGEILGEPLLAVPRSVVLLAMFAFIALGRTHIGRVAEMAAAALVPAAASFATFAVLRTVGLDDHGARALATVGAAVAVVWSAAIWSMRYKPATPASSATARSATVEGSRRFPSTRVIIDIGAALTVLVLAWDVDADLRGAMLAVIAAGFLGASICRGWAARLSDRIAGVPSTRAEGVPTRAAPRRLLAWPALAFASAALWQTLWHASGSSPGAISITVEAYTIAPATALFLFAALLVWLRRHREAAVAVSASFALGLLVTGVAGWSGDLQRGTVVAAVSAGLCVLLTCTPALRARTPALAGAGTALLALGVVTLQRAVEWAFAGDAGERSLPVAWLLLLVATAYVSAFGAVRSRPADGRRSMYAAFVPPLAIAAATGAGILSAQILVVLVIALVVLAGLHLAAAGIGRDPFGAATRWTTLIAAALFGIAGFVGGAVDVGGLAVVELVSIPIALIVLAGSAVARWRHHRSAEATPTAEDVAWLGGVLVAIVPSILEPVEPLRVWLVVLVALTIALVTVLIPVQTPRVVHPWSVVILTTGALVMGARALAPQQTFVLDDLAVAVAGTGAIVVSVAMIWTAASHPVRRTAAASALTAGGAALLLAMVIVRSDGEIIRTTVTAIIAAAAAVGGSYLLGSPRWRGTGAIIAIAGFAAALVAVAARLIEIFDEGDPSLEADLWALIALGITAAIGIMALRSSASTSVERMTRVAVGIAFAAGLAFFTVVELILLSEVGDGEWRAAIAMCVLTVAGVGGVLGRSRLGLTVPITAAISGVVLGLVCIAVYGISPVELITAPPALGLLVLGARTLRNRPESRTWPTLGPGLILLTVPSLLHDFGPADLWRVVSLGIAAIALTVVGAVRRLQAPLIVGSIVLLIHGLAQLWPWISTSYVEVPWWLWLGIGGAVLIFLAARYEKNMRALRTSFLAVTSLR